MTAWQEFLLFLQTYLGTIVLALLIILGILLLVYSLVTRGGRRSQPSLAAALDEHYLEEEQAVRSVGITFASGPSVGFFGRVSVVRRVGTDEHGLCLFPTPNLIDDEACARLSTYGESLTRDPIEGMAPVLWYQAVHGMMGIVQGEIVRPDGHLRMTLREYLLDRRLTSREKEGILLAIAHVLQSLHKRNFYHGWLLPRSLYVILDPERVICGIRVADSGLAYSFGPEKMNRQLQMLRGRELGMDAYRSHRLVNELVHLSPEQQQKERLKEVGLTSDFYAFGSIAGRLFSEVPLYGPAEIDWSKMPDKWAPFLKACLSDDRPTDFSQLWPSF